MISSDKLNDYVIKQANKSKLKALAQGKYFRLAIDKVQAYLLNKIDKETPNIWAYNYIVSYYNPFDKKDVKEAKSFLKDFPNEYIPRRKGEILRLAKWEFDREIRGYFFV